MLESPAIPHTYSDSSRPPLFDGALRVPAPGRTESDQGAKSPLGNIGIKPSPSGEPLDILDKNSWLNQKRKRLWAENYAQARFQNMQVQRAISEKNYEDVKFFTHGARGCGKRPIPSHSKKADGEIYLTGHPGYAVINASPDGVAYSTHMQHCGSTWLCLSCAEKIFRTRRDEIKKAFDFFNPDAGFSKSHVTFTNPHSINDNLPDLLERMAEALTAFRSGKAWKEFRARFGYVGEIRTLEIPYGNNGWHPHYHSVYFWDRVHSDAEKDAIEAWIKRRWLAISEKYGFIKNAVERHGHREHGVNVKTSTDPLEAMYLAKIEVWELASTTSKTSRGIGGMSHWEVKRRATIDKDPKYIPLWADFMRATRGRKAIWWSKGLKEMVGVVEKTDGEIVEEQECPGTVEAVLSKDDCHFAAHFQLHRQIFRAVERKVRGDPKLFDALRRLGRRCIQPDIYKHLHLTFFDS